MGSEQRTEWEENGIEPVERKHESLRRLNDEIARSASRASPVGEKIPFVCECARNGCFRVVWLSLSAYQRLRDHPKGLVLAAPHKPRTEARSPRGPGSRRRAAEPREREVAGATV